MPTDGDRIDPLPCGATTTNGLTGRAVTFATSLEDTNYHVSVSLVSAAPTGVLGEVSYAKTTGGVTIYNTGDSALNITYSVQLF